MQAKSFQLHQLHQLQKKFKRRDVCEFYLNPETSYKGCWLESFFFNHIQNLLRKVFGWAASMIQHKYFLGA